ncbi:signal peptidase I [Trebonia sp.]|uniref:signal peptidase I n=1 Tax=Trebonia sp. TaxID=2767075 RepID=UPI00260305D6|nr:signal peptidase I [Trebonia sp.]
MASDPGWPRSEGAPDPQCADKQEDAAGHGAAVEAAQSDDPGREPAQSAPGQPAKRRARKRGKRQRPFWRELAVIVVAALVLTVLLKAFVVQVFSIPSGSMENTLVPGDRVLVNKLIYHFRPIARGDIVVFSGQGSWDPPAPPPSSDPLVRLWHDVTNLVGISAPGTDYIKRVIGLPGDHVACCDAQGRVTVNGVPLNEQSYIYPGDAPSQVPFSITVPPGRLWVMGDNRADSDDSRYRMDDPGEGTIPESAVVGRAFVVIWPLSRLAVLPIPATFQQAGLRAAAAAAPAAPAVGGGSAALAAGIVCWRRRRRRGPR